MSSEKFCIYGVAGSVGDLCYKREASPMREILLTKIYIVKKSPENIGLLFLKKC